MNSEDSPVSSPPLARFEACTLGERRFAPARFCAPLAGYTHSAFRRLVSELGGCGALWTEMLAARQILREDFRASPWLRRSSREVPLVYQLMVRAGDPLEAILGRLAEQGADAVDLNLACDALAIRACAAGSALYENAGALGQVLSETRRHWPGLLTAKIRLGSRRPDWEARFRERIRQLEDAGLDAVIVHPRFFEEKFRRRARHELIPWVRSLTRLPIIASGDLVSAEQVETLHEHLSPACALMIGRMAIVRPWLFAAWGRNLEVKPAEIWARLFEYIREDFAPAVALRRIQMFTKYYAANFAFGHRFYVEVSHAPSLEAIARCATEFFGRSPTLLTRPTVAGL